MKNKNGQIEDSVTTDESMKLTISCKKNVFDIEHLEFQYLENVPVLQDINLTIDHDSCKAVKRSVKAGGRQHLLRW